MSRFLFHVLEVSFGIQISVGRSFLTDPAPHPVWLIILASLLIHLFLILVYHQVKSSIEGVSGEAGGSSLIAIWKSHPGRHTTNPVNTTSGNTTILMANPRIIKSTSWKKLQSSPCIEPSTLLLALSKSVGCS
jgi:hypothetical protein